MKAKHHTTPANELQPGDTVITAIGKARIDTVRPSHNGIEVVLSTSHNTRPVGEGTVLWFYQSQPVRIVKKRVRKSA